MPARRDLLNGTPEQVSGILEELSRGKIGTWPEIEKATEIVRTLLQIRTGLTEVQPQLTPRKEG